MLQRQNNPLNRSRTPERRQQVQPGPAVLASGSQVTSLQDDIAALQISVAYLQDQAVDFEARISALEAGQLDHEARIAALEP